MTYSASDVSKRLGLSKDTLRYYEREELLPPIHRDASGHRAYSDADVEWIFLIRCLRDTDMPIRRIKQYVSLLMNGGGDSILERKDILLEHEAFIREKITAYRNLLRLIEKKISFYNEASHAENSAAVACMDYAAEWKHFRTILKGSMLK